MDNPAPNQSTPNSTPEANTKPTIKIRKPRINRARSRSLIDKLEQKIGTKVICYYTGTSSSINDSHPDIFFEHLNNIDHQETLSLILVSNGGSGTSSLRIANILREHCNKLYVIVPSRCASAATMLALSANKIIMSPAGYLTAIDSSLTMSLNPKGADGKPARVSVDQVKRVLKLLEDEGPTKSSTGGSEGSYRTLFRYLHPLALGEIDRASSSSELIARKMMMMHKEDFGPDKFKIEELANHLVNNYPTHGFPILFQEAKEIGLPVEKTEKEVAQLLWDLTKLYDVISLQETTQLSPELRHHEGFPIIIESSEKRTAFGVNYNKRFNPVAKRWETENDTTMWVNIRLSPQDETKIDITPLDIPTQNQTLVTPPNEATSETSQTLQPSEAPQTAKTE